MAAPGDFLPSRLIARAGAGGGLTRVSIEASPQIAASYVSPGQYIEMKAGDETGFFVLASEPGSTPWELVMRSGGGASDVVLAMPVGSPVEITRALGHGFPLDDVRGRPLVVVLHGTGVAAGPPLVRHRIRGGDAARTTVLVGARVERELPMQQELLAWSAAGVDVTVCLSQGDPVELDRGLRVVRGYVQDVLAARASSGDLRVEPGRTLVFAVGATSVVAALRAVVHSLGLRSEDVRTNH